MVSLSCLVCSLASFGLCCLVCGFIVVNLACFSSAAVLLAYTVFV